MPEIYKAADKTPKATEPWWREMIRQVLDDVGETPRRSVMGAYCVYPGLKFITQQQDEDIVLMLRAHPITNLGWILLTLLMLAAPTLLLSSGAFAMVAGKFIFVGRLVWYLMTLAYAFEKFLNWYYSVFIVTNERLVDIDFNNLLWREITYANLDHIEEPEMVTGGFIRSLLRYGDVRVTTASEAPTVEALGVPYPERVIDIISRLAEELVKRRKREE